jgi:hypothetical protein
MVGRLNSATPLKIYWQSRPLPENAHLYWRVAVGDGAVYVRKNLAYQDPEAMSQRPECWAPNRYAWNDFSDMIVVFMPLGYTAIDVRPPARANTFGNRIAFIWPR